MADAAAYVVRHGMHDLLRPGRNRLAGRMPGVSLNEDGRRESERVAEILAGRPMAWVAAGPLERTVETAALIAGRHGLPVERDERFIESGLGPWEGLWIDDIQARFPDEWQAWREDPSRVHLDGIEPVERIADRMEEGLQAWLARGGHGVIVSHQDPIAALLCRVVGMPLSAMRAWDIRTASICTVRATSHGLVVENVNSGAGLSVR